MQRKDTNMQTPAAINIEDYTYELPDQRIARFPLAERDASKLLVYRSGKIASSTFRQIGDFLPSNSLLVFNDTRVIHARLRFTLPNGANIEILCLEPLQPAEYQQNLSASGEVIWKCLIGNNRKWKNGVLDTELKLEKQSLALHIERIGRTEDAFEVRFQWPDENISFGELLAEGGIIPLPPYLKRDSTPDDKHRYQTIYAHYEGSVAAPTAGLHFTDRVFEQLAEKGIDRTFLTLHVGAGTFKPVSSATLGGHHMHSETVAIKLSSLETILQALSDQRPIITVGTTASRVLESIYWHGALVLRGQKDPVMHIPQWLPYEENIEWPTPKESLTAVIHQLKTQGLASLEGSTQLLIAPPYSYRLIRGLITNFHQPKSTLMLLVAAMVGEDWRQIYQYALEQDFRFLSYGDSNLLFP